MLVELERRGVLDAVVTQNIDGLHRPAGTRRLVEVHGSIDSSSCLSCRAVFPLEEVRARLEASPVSVPACDCGAPLKPDVVLFGEFLPPGALEEAYALAAGADVLLCVGSSLEVHPIAQLPGVTRQAGGEVAIVTAGPTPWDAHAAVRLDGDVVDELEAVPRRPLNDPRTRRVDTSPRITRSTVHSTGSGEAFAAAEAVAAVAGGDAVARTAAALTPSARPSRARRVRCARAGAEAVGAGCRRRGGRRPRRRSATSSPSPPVSTSFPAAGLAS